MDKVVLRLAHVTALNMARSHSLKGLFPQSLSSLEKSNPSNEEIYNDYSKLTTHFKHPVFKNFIPTYYEMVDCPKTAWQKRLSISFNYLNNYTVNKS